MTNIILSREEFARLKAVYDNAKELCGVIPYIIAAGGTLTNQHRNVLALTNALRECEQDALHLENPMIQVELASTEFKPSTFPDRIDIDRLLAKDRSDDAPNDKPRTRTAKSRSKRPTV